MMEGRMWEENRIQPVYTVWNSQYILSLELKEEV